jgi:hypothetical protein
MSDTGNHFHEFALQSTLFKGRSDWYFCFLKAEKIAQVLLVIGDASPAEAAQALRPLTEAARRLPESIARLAAGELEREGVLADIFALRSAVRLTAAARELSQENALLISQEYERIAHKIGAQGEPSPFVTTDDFAVPQLRRATPGSLPSRTSGARNLKDTDKGHSAAAAQELLQRPTPAQKQERANQILEVIRARQGASIKEIAAVVKGCGEKTIQRELAALIEEGLVRKEGERRWSVYKPVSGL